MRRLFCVKPPDVMIGADLKSIEANIAGHHSSKFDGGEYWNFISSVDDLHSHNAQLINNTRDVAKSFQYAIYFGAQAPKLSRILGCTIPEAERYIESFWSGNKGVKYIIDDLEKQYKKNKFIVGLDGRKLQVRQKYKLLNTLIQSSAAIVFKRWGIIANERLMAAGNHCRQIIAYHDEYVYRCEPDYLEDSKQIILDSAIDAGKYYNLYVPIAADCKVGANWAEVH